MRIILYIPKITNYLKILTNNEVKDFVLTNFGAFSKLIREELYSNLSEEKSLGKVVELFYSFLTTPDEAKKYVELIEKTPEAKIMMQLTFSDNCMHVYNIDILSNFDVELQLTNNKPTIKNI